MLCDSRILGSLLFDDMQGFRLLMNNIEIDPENSGKTVSDRALAPDRTVSVVV